TVQLDVQPGSVAAAPNSDTAVVADGAPDGHGLAVASLDSSAQSGRIDVGQRPDQVVAPGPIDPSSLLVVISDADNTARSFDPTTQALGTPVKLGAGPHAASFANSG